jgi:hypothetical protein
VSRMKEVSDGRLKLKHANNEKVSSKVDRSPGHGEPVRVIPSPGC